MAVLIFLTVISTDIKYYQIIIKELIIKGLIIKGLIIIIIIIIIKGFGGNKCHNN